MRARTPFTRPVALAVALASCATGPAGPRVLSSASLRAHPTYQVEWITTYPSALATVIDAMERELGFPRFDVSLYFFAGRDAFEAGLVEVGYPPPFARDTARVMTAIGGFRAVLINEEKLALRAWPDRIGTLAHELTHSLQYELGGGTRGTSEQWLREGFADWVALRVLERLGVTSVHDGRRRSVDELRRRKDGAVPRLDEMVTFPQWVALGQGPAARVLYDHAFVAVDFLIRRHGLESVVRYFGMFAGASDRLENFRLAFGEELPAFERALRGHLWPARERSASER